MLGNGAMKSSTARVRSEPLASPKPTGAPNRREAVRLEMAYPVVLSRLGDPSTVVSTTKNISKKGFFCVCERPFSPNEVLNCELTLPAVAGRSPSAGDLVLRGRVEVVRVALRGMEPGFGIACEIKDYTVLSKVG